MIRGNRTKRNGFVLVMALLVIAMAGVSLSIEARRAARRATDVRHAELALRRRWAVWSTRRTLSPRLETIIEKETEKRATIQSMVRGAYPIGDDQITWMIADEQARLNVNTVLARQGRYDAESLIEELVRQAGRDAHVRLKPYRWPDDAQSPPLATLAQVFENPQLDMPEDETTTDRTVTCWGDGRLNVKRAEAGTLQALLGPMLHRMEIARMIQARDDAPKATLADLLRAAELDDERAKDVQMVLTAKSACHSIRLRCEGPAGPADYLFIVERVDNNQEKLLTRSFRW